MLRQRKKTKNQNAQSVLEYTIILGIITVVIISMSAMVKRFAQGTVKMVADHIGNQVNGDQEVNEERGYLEGTYVVTLSNIDTTTLEQFGERVKVFNDVTVTHTNTFSDLGQQDSNPWDDEFN